MAAIIGEKMEVTGGGEHISWRCCRRRSRLPQPCPAVVCVLPPLSSSRLACAPVFSQQGTPTGACRGFHVMGEKQDLHGSITQIHRCHVGLFFTVMEMCTRNAISGVFSNVTLCSGDWRRSGGGRDRLQPPADSHAHLRYPPPLSPVPIHVVFAVSSLKCCRLHPRPVGKPFRHTSASSLAAKSIIYPTFESTVPIRGDVESTYIRTLCRTIAGQVQSIPWSYDNKSAHLLMTDEHRQVFDEKSCCCCCLL
ncbi:hypothetical protein BHE74_00041106 [Ensete ventricosum]|nr:hypothetical protein BHE74_00041106 [Ensete ventricosum]